MACGVLRFLVGALQRNEAKRGPTCTRLGCGAATPLPLAPAAGAVYPRPCRL